MTSLTDSLSPSLRRSFSPSGGVGGAGVSSPTSGGTELACDYDSSCTYLYRHLEASEWDLARMRAGTHPSEVRTWVIRRDRQTSQVRWKLLPIHASIIFQAPVRVVKAFLDVHHEGASRQDDQGLLPIHLLFRNKNIDEEVLDLLIKHYPEGIHVKDNRGRNPLAHAAGISPGGAIMKKYAEAAILAEKKKRTHASDVSLASSTRAPSAASSMLAHPAAATTKPAASITEEEQYESETSSGASAEQRGDKAASTLPKPQRIPASEPTASGMNFLSSMAGGLTSGLRQVARSPSPTMATTATTAPEKNNPISGTTPSPQVHFSSFLSSLPASAGLNQQQSQLYTTMEARRSPPPPTTTTTTAAPATSPPARATSPPSQHFSPATQTPDFTDESSNSYTIPTSNNKYNSGTTNHDVISKSDHVTELKRQTEAHARLSRRKDEEHNKHIEEMNRQHERQLNELRAQYEKQMEHLQTQMKVSQEQTDLMKDGERRQLTELHDKQMDMLRQSLRNELSEKTEINTMLREEVKSLKDELSRARGEGDMLKALMEGMKLQQRELVDVIQSIVDDQNELMDLVYTQREEMDTAHGVRDKLIQTLLQQEEEDRAHAVRTADDLVDLAETIRDRIDDVLARAAPDADEMGGGGGGITAGLEGVEEAIVEVSHESDLTDEAEDKFGGNSGGGRGFEVHGFRGSRSSGRKVHHVVGGHSKADDISAITEYSGY